LNSCSKSLENEENVPIVDSKESEFVNIANEEMNFKIISEKLSSIMENDLIVKKFIVNEFKKSEFNEVLFLELLSAEISSGQRSIDKFEDFLIKYGYFTEKDLNRIVKTIPDLELRLESPNIKPDYE
jgi:hypothetical protein